MFISGWPGQSGAKRNVPRDRLRCPRGTPNGGLACLSIPQGSQELIPACSRPAREQAKRRPPRTVLGGRHTWVGEARFLVRRRELVRGVLRTGQLPRAP